MNNFFTDPLIFLIEVIVGFYTLAVMLRLLLQWMHADFYNPLAQFVVKITNPVLVPLRRLIPGFGGIDWASIILLLLLAGLKLFLIFGVQGRLVPFVSLAPLILADLIALALNIFMFTIFVQVIISWVAPNQYNPAAVLMHQLNEPLLRPIRRLLPPLGGMDLSPFVAVVLIQLSKMLLVRALYSLAA
jgi:YggT family protein